MTQAQQVTIDLKFTHGERMASAVRSIAIAQESLRRSLREASQSLSGHLHVLRAWDNGATPVDRAYARAYLRAATRSRRNQPPVSIRCWSCGDAGEVMDAVLLPSGHTEVWNDCPECGDRPPIRRASASRKRRPHGRPR